MMLLLAAVAAAAAAAAADDDDDDGDGDGGGGGGGGGGDGDGDGDNDDDAGNVREKTIWNIETDIFDLNSCNWSNIEKLDYISSFTDGSRLSTTVWWSQTNEKPRGIEPSNYL